MRAKAWLKAEDFDKGLAVARTRLSGSRRVDVVTPLPEPMPAPAIEPHCAGCLKPARSPRSPRMQQSRRALESPPPVPTEPSEAAIAGAFQMRFDGHARFVRPWRVWMKRKT